MEADLRISIKDYPWTKSQLLLCGVLPLPMLVRTVCQLTLADCAPPVWRIAVEI